MKLSELRTANNLVNQINDLEHRLAKIMEMSGSSEPKFIISGNNKIELVKVNRVFTLQINNIESDITDLKTQFMALTGTAANKYE